MVTLDRIRLTGLLPKTPLRRGFPLAAPRGNRPREAVALELAVDVDRELHRARGGEVDPVRAEPILCENAYAPHGTTVIHENLCEAPRITLFVIRYWDETWP